MILPRNIAENDKKRIEYVEKIIEREKEALNAIKTAKIYDNIIVHNKSQDPTYALYEKMENQGISLKPGGDKFKKLALSHFGTLHWDNYINGFYAQNLRTENEFESYLNSMATHNVTVMWHGSKNSNWLSLLNNGTLSINKTGSNAGNMFGPGLYFAPNANKSAGYVSLATARWNHGGEVRRIGILGLFRVNLGKVLDGSKANNRMNYDTLHKMGYDSVYAKSGTQNLRMDEAIVYREDQATIYGIVIIKGTRGY
jgi:poly [ADP-ribose] polymerase